MPLCDAVHTRGLSEGEAFAGSRGDYSLRFVWCEIRGKICDIFPTVRTEVCCVGTFSKTTPAPDRPRDGALFSHWTQEAFEDVGEEQFFIIHSKWLVPSKPHVNPPEARLHASSWRPRPPGRAHRPPAASRSHTGTGPEPSLSVRSAVTRRALNCSSASCPSSA